MLGTLCGSLVVTKQKPEKKAWMLHLHTQKSSESKAYETWIVVTDFEDQAAGTVHPSPWNTPGKFWYTLLQALLYGATFRALHSTHLCWRKNSCLPESQRWFHLNNLLLSYCSGSQLWCCSQCSRVPRANTFIKESLLYTFISLKPICENQDFH